MAFHQDQNFKSARENSVNIFKNPLKNQGEADTCIKLEGTAADRNAPD